MLFTLCSLIVNAPRTYVPNNFFLSFPQVKNKPSHRGNYAFNLEQGAVANTLHDILPDVFNIHSCTPSLGVTVHWSFSNLYKVLIGELSVLSLLHWSALVPVTIFSNGEKAFFPRSGGR
jgi:hypothetical protein